MSRLWMVLCVMLLLIVVAGGGSAFALNSVSLAGDQAIATVASGQTQVGLMAVAQTGAMSIGADQRTNFVGGACVAVTQATNKGTDVTQLTNCGCFPQAAVAASQAGWTNGTVLDLTTSREPQAVVAQERITANVFRRVTDGATIRNGPRTTSLFHPGVAVANDRTIIVDADSNLTTQNPKMLRDIGWQMTSSGPLALTAINTTLAKQAIGVQIRQGI